MLKKGVLLIIIASKHYQSVSEIFHLCNKSHEVLLFCEQQDFLFRIEDIIFPVHIVQNDL